MNKRLSANSIYLIYAGATAFFFSLVFTVSQIYRIEIGNLNALELVLVGTVLEASCFLFEIPTGIVADIYSRKLSIIIGLILIGSGFLLEGIVPLFATIIIAQVLWGVGYTFLSGADEAWIADELEGRNLDRIYLKGTQIGQVFSFIGIITSTLIGTIALNIPMLIGGGLFIALSIFLMLFMNETGFNPISREERSSWGQMIHTFKSGVSSIKKNKILVIMMGISLIYGLYSEGFDRLWNAHFIENITFPMFVDFKPIVWFGIINGLAMILSIIAVEIIKRDMDKRGKLEKVWLLLFINILMVGFIIGFGLSGNFKLASMTYLGSYILRTTNGPLYRSWMNKNIEPRVRATVLSTYGQLDALGQIIGGPVIGYIALKISISGAITSSGIILFPVVLLFVYVLLKGKKQTNSSYKGN